MLHTPSALFRERRRLAQDKEGSAQAEVRSAKQQVYIGIYFMSQHRSLRAAATLGGKRNVLKRFERIELLKKRGQWKSGDRITGLRKTKREA
jgi:small basic protein (TIGR04137 family)